MVMSTCEEYRKERLEGKSEKRILAEIRSLKREMKELKEILEDPKYQRTIFPSEDTILSCTRDYLEAAKQTLADIGGTYTPTKEEQKLVSFKLKEFIYR